MPTLPRRDGLDLELRPSIQLWLEIERQFGALGALYKAHRELEFRLDVYLTLLYKAARAVETNDPTLTFADVQQAVADLGLLRAFEIVDALFDDIFKVRPAPAVADDGQPKADDVPLAVGGSTPTSSTGSETPQ